MSNGATSLQNEGHRYHMKGMNHILNQVRWQYFFHLTFKQEVSEQTTIHAYKGFAGKLTREFLGRSKESRNKLIHFAQIEFGSSGRHLHLHGCLAGLHRNVSETAIAEIWETCIHEGGDAKVDKYDTSRDGVSYALKIWENPQRVALMQSAESWPIYSKSVVECLRRRGEG